MNQLIQLAPGDQLETGLGQPENFGTLPYCSTGSQPVRSTFEWAIRCNDHNDRRVFGSATAGGNKIESILHLGGEASDNVTADNDRSLNVFQCSPSIFANHSHLVRFLEETYLSRPKEAILKARSH